MLTCERLAHSENLLEYSHIRFEKTERSIEKSSDPNKNPKDLIRKHEGFSILFSLLYLQPMAVIFNILEITTDFHPYEQKFTINCQHHITTTVFQNLRFVVMHNNPYLI
jgi:hypothetical protein